MKALENQAKMYNFRSSITIFAEYLLRCMSHLWRDYQQHFTPFRNSTETIQIPRTSNIWFSMTGFCSQHVTLHPQTAGSSVRWCKALGGCLPLPGQRSKMMTFKARLKKLRVEWNAMGTSQRSNNQCYGLCLVAKHPTVFNKFHQRPNWYTQCNYSASILYQIKNQQ